MKRASVVVIAVAVAVLGLSGCTAAPPAPTATADGAPAPAEVVASGLDAPWSIAVHRDTVLISERDSGRILQLGADGETRELGVVDGVVHGGEGGLLGLAFDSGGRLYAYSTGESGNRIQRFDDPDDLGDADTILDGLPAAGNHNGGRLAFGPDGMLYASVGDAGDPSRAQDEDSLGGKILRITTDGDPAPGNPDPGSPVWSMGHRNVQGLAWTADGTMYATEFGQDTWDELNIIEPGANYGWPEVEGAGGEDRGFTDPVRQWRTDEASPSGLAIVRDVILVANLRGERLRALTAENPQSSVDLHTGDRVRDVTVTPEGEIWMLTNNTDGRGDPGPDDDRILRVELPTG